LYRNEGGDLDDKAKQETGMSGQVEPSGYEIKARVEKSSVCRPYRTATMRFDLDKLEFDRMFEYSKAARHYNIVSTTSNGRYEYKGTKMHGEKQLRALIKGDVTLQEEIRAAAMQAAMQ
jgi:hypothetical protein